MVLSVAGQPAVVLASMDVARNDLSNGSVGFRVQRHNGIRVIMATQEPTTSGRLLDLCSVSIIHRFNSPAWFTAIREHLSGASTMVKSDEDGEKDASRADLFRSILALEVGESLVFSPNSWVQGGEVPGSGGRVVEPTRLGSGVHALNGNRQRFMPTTSRISPQT
jgi:hypothetical protein